MQAPNCCGVSAVWNDNVPSKPDWFCRECKNEVVDELTVIQELDRPVGASPILEAPYGRTIKFTEEELESVMGCTPPGSLVWNKDGMMEKRKGHTGPVAFQTPLVPVAKPEVFADYGDHIHCVACDDLVATFIQKKYRHEILQEYDIAGAQGHQFKAGEKLICQMCHSEQPLNHLRIKKQPNTMIMGVASEVFQIGDIVVYDLKTELLRKVRPEDET